MKILREMVRSTTMGIDAIDHILPYAGDDELASLMRTQQLSMSELREQAKRGLSEDEIAAAEGGKLAKTMLKASSTVSAIVNNGDVSHFAKMLIEGYETGIVSLQKCLNEMREAHEDVPACAKELLKLYDKHVRALRKFL